MATIKIVQDKRVAKGDAPLKIAIAHRGQRVYFGLNISVKPDQFDPEKGLVVRHPNRCQINQLINRRRLDIENALYKISECNKISSLSASQLRNLIETEIGEVDSPEQQTINPELLFVNRYRKYIDNCKKERTAEIYSVTLKRLYEFSKSLDKIQMEDITTEWLNSFEQHLAKTESSPNSRAIHLRNIRAVFNAAIDDGITTFYPFRKFKIKTIETPKRSLTVEQLREFIDCPLERTEEQYRDMFLLIFYLIGINTVDLLALKQITQDGYVEYIRSKTSKLYRIKVEPEALAIINKYKGENWLLNVMDRYSNYKDYSAKLNKHLKNIGPVSYKRTKAYAKHFKKIFHPLFPNLTTYWARHTWATIAASVASH